MTTMGLRQEVVSLELAGIRRDEKWLVLNARDGKFLAFFGKKISTQKTRPGKQTSNTYADSHCKLQTKSFCKRVVFERTLNFF